MSSAAHAHASWAAASRVPVHTRPRCPGRLRSNQHGFDFRRGAGEYILGRRRRRELFVVAAEAAVDAEEDASGGGVAGGAKPARLEGEILNRLMADMAEDLTHLFDDRGIDPGLYEVDVRFEDPLTRYDNIQGYLFNIGMLKNVFRPTYTMHSIEQTGDWELSTRWTMEMSLPQVPFFWQPKLTFTGTSVMGYNPDTLKVKTHFDTWDSIDTQGYLASPEGVVEIMRQIFDVTATPDLETPKYAVLRRFASYEVREYEPFLVAETRTGAAGGTNGGGGNAFGTLAGYIFGQGNETGEKMEMTTPVFMTEGKMKFVMSPKFTRPEQLPAPKQGSGVDISSQPGGVYAALRFNGIATDDAARDAEEKLDAALRRDGFTRAAGVPCSLAQYNEPLTNPLRRRNEVLVLLDGFDKREL